MPFQTSIRFDQTTGIVGDVFLDGPSRSNPAILATSDATLNVIGRAFTHVAANDLTVVAGGTGAFAGILVNSKEYTTSGTAAGGTLAPTITLPNNTTVSLMTMGTVIINSSTAAAIGDDVHFVQATGALLAVAAGTSPAVGNSVVPGAKIVRYNTGGAGLAVMQITN